LQNLILMVKNINIGLFSRRSVDRAGTRFWSRGIDSEGNVSNFVESEQVLYYNNKVLSFVQIRGSIPLSWTQTPSLHYEPKLSIEAEIKPYIKHVLQSKNLYGKLLIVSLINHHGSQGRLNNEFKKIVDQTKDEDVRLVLFDFHKETKGMKYDNVNKLVSSIEKEIQEYGYYMRDRDEENIQRGIIRTNCMDNLDRTNVVQATFAKYILKDQLNRENILDKTEFDNNKELQSLLNHTWANKGDIIAIQYAGTGAMKSDFTRYGKRTIKGSIVDGLNSATRYYLNNFTDGLKEDSLNLFIGNYQVSNNHPSPFSGKKNLSKILVIIILILTLLSTYYVFGMRENFIYYFIFYVIFLLINFRMILFLGKSVVDKPVLIVKQKVE